MEGKNDSRGVERSTVRAGVTVNSVRLDSYKKLMGRLPPKIAETAENLYHSVFCLDPHHPMLSGKWVTDRRKSVEVWRVDISRGYRALAWVEEKKTQKGLARTYVWYWCGSHEDYNNLV